MFGPTSCITSENNESTKRRGVPVSNTIFPTSPPSLTSFGIKFFNVVLMQRVGCLSSWKSSTASSPSTKVGLQDGSPSAADDFAKLNRQSSSAKTLIARSHRARSTSNSLYSRNLKALMAAVRFSWASFNCRTRFCRDPTTKRFLAWNSPSSAQVRRWF